jgi:threonine dehydratase
MIVEVSTAIVTDAGGDATVHLGTRLRGRVHAIKYTKGTLDAGTDLVITGETTGVAILTDSPAANEWLYPRVFPNAVTTGAAGTVATEAVHVLNERIKVVVAQGGNTLVGSIAAYIDTPDPY